MIKACLRLGQIVTYSKNIERLREIIQQGKFASDNTEYELYECQISNFVMDNNEFLEVLMNSAEHIGVLNRELDQSKSFIEGMGKNIEKHLKTP